MAGSGKIGGHVMSKNRGGAYMRTKVTPSNPNSSAQQGARALLSSLSTAWAGLTDAERASWNGAVQDYSSTDIFGDIKNPSGINLFVKLNANLSNTGQTLLTVAPTKIEIPFAPILSATVNQSLETLTVTFDGVAMTGTSCLVRACPPVSQGISNVKSRMRVLGAFVAPFSSDDVYAAYVAKFGHPPLGANLSLSVQPVVATGQAGTIQAAKVAVLA